MPRGSYHHGNLRQALVDATAELIEEKGPLAFTLSEAARRAGVSVAAPYRHFAGREDLLIEVARQGFIDFTARLEAAFDDARPDPVTAIQRIGVAYLLFARERQGVYMAMFESGHNFIAMDPPLPEAAQSYKLLYRASDALFQGVDDDQRPPTAMVANHIWSISHGIVELFTRGAPQRLSEVSAEDMLATAGLIYFRGLGVIPR